MQFFQNFNESRVIPESQVSESYKWVSLAESFRDDDDDRDHDDVTRDDDDVLRDTTKESL